MILRDCFLTQGAQITQAALDRSRSIGATTTSSTNTQIWTIYLVIPDPSRSARERGNGSGQCRTGDESGASRPSPIPSPRAALCRAARNIPSALRIELDALRLKNGEGMPTARRRRNKPESARSLKKEFAVRDIRAQITERHIEWSHICSRQKLEARVRARRLPNARAAAPNARAECALCGHRASRRLACLSRGALTYRISPTPASQMAPSTPTSQTAAGL